jgi:hypothetical protein
MRRYYAFEAEGVSEEVKAQLEKVEDVVEDKCETKADCEKILDKIEAEEDKFNGALGNMADAAKDCKDGKCDKAEMVSKINPEMAQLKEVAKSIGVASEGETVTEAEVKDAKDYLEGAKEIVEAKMDEIGGSDKGDDEDDAECDAADESFDIGGRTIMLSDLAALEAALPAEISYCNIAMEGYNWDKRKEYKDTMRTANNALKKAKNFAKQGDEANTKAALEECVNGLKQSKADFVKACREEQSAGNAICGYFAYCWRGFGLSLLGSALLGIIGSGAVSIKHSVEFWVDIIQAVGKGEDRTPSDLNMYTKSMEHNMDMMISHVQSVAKKLNLKAAKKAAKKGGAAVPDGGDEGASESFLNFEEFIAGCEAYTIPKASRNKVPYLFD